MTNLCILLFGMAFKVFFFSKKIHQNTSKYRYNKIESLANAGEFFSEELSRPASHTLTSLFYMINVDTERCWGLAEELAESVGPEVLRKQIVQAKLV